MLRSELHPELTESVSKRAPCGGARGVARLRGA